LENKAGQETVIMFEDNNIPAPYLYYATGSVKLLSGLSKVPAASLQDIVDLKGINKIYQFEYLVDITDPNRFLQKKIESEFKKIETLNFSGVGFVYVYER